MPFPSSPHCTPTITIPGMGNPLAFAGFAPADELALFGRGPILSKRFAAPSREVSAAGVDPAESAGKRRRMAPAAARPDVGRHCRSKDVSSRIRRPRDPHRYRSAEEAGRTRARRRAGHRGAVGFGLHRHPRRGPALRPWRSGTAAHGGRHRRVDVHRAPARHPHPGPSPLAPHRGVGRRLVLRLQPRPQQRRAHARCGHRRDGGQPRAPHGGRLQRTVPAGGIPEAARHRRNPSRSSASC